MSFGSGGGAWNLVWGGKLKRARNAANDEERRAQGLITEGYDKALGYQQPWDDYGQTALKDFQTWGSDPNAITSDPSYKWRLGQGTEALENSAAARGGLLSGNTGKALSSYGQGMASQEYGNEFSRWLQKLGIGQNASSNMANLQTGRTNALSGAVRSAASNQWNRLLDQFETTRQGELALNSILQSWVPASGGGGNPQPQSSGSPGKTSGGSSSSGLDSSYQGTSSSFGSQYGGGNYGGGYF